MQQVATATVVSATQGLLCIFICTKIPRLMCPMSAMLLCPLCLSPLGKASLSWTLPAHGWCNIRYLSQHLAISTVLKTRLQTAKSLVMSLHRYVPEGDGLIKDEDIDFMAKRWPCRDNTLSQEVGTLAAWMRLALSYNDYPAALSSLA